MARILYIDDEIELLDLAAIFFEDENLPIETCSDFHEALKLVEKNSYAIVISDAKLPSGSGPELIRTIKKNGFKGKTVLVSGNVQDPSEIIDIGYDEVVLKPIDFVGLIEKIKSLLIP